MLAARPRLKSSPLRRTAMKPRTKPMKARSAKRVKTYTGDDGRAAFVVATLEARPFCEVRSMVCSRRAIDVHESIIRSRGGAIVPGPLATLQGQRFFSICRICHDFAHAQRQWSENRGFLDPRNQSQIPQRAG